MRLFNIKPIYLNIHKTYKVIMAVLVGIMLLVQLALTTPNGRSVFTFVDRFEGVLSSEGNVSNLGEIKLSLVGVLPSQHIEVLQNGQPIAYFYDSSITVTVSDNSVIEIDGRKIEEPFLVEVAGVSSNIEIENATTAAEVNSDIALIGRVFIKDRSSA